MKKNLLLALFAFSSLLIHAQEVKQSGSIILINGKTVPFKLIESDGYDLVYRTPDPKSKLKKMDPERVFSLQYMDGTERIIFQQDTLDPLEFTIDEMRLFIKGEQDADLHYHNNLNKGVAFVVGAAASSIAIYGLPVPFAYAAIVGSFTPDVTKIKGANQEMLKIPEYREGFEKKARDRKIRNALVSGFIGFAAGFTTLIIIGNN